MLVCTCRGDMYPFFGEDAGNNIEMARETYSKVIQVAAQESAELYQTHAGNGTSKSAPPATIGLNCSATAETLTVSPVPEEEAALEKYFTLGSPSSCQTHDQSLTQCPHLTLRASSSTAIVLRAADSMATAIATRDIRAPKKGALCCFSINASLMEADVTPLTISRLRATQRGKHTPVGRIRKHDSSRSLFYITVQQKNAEWGLDVSARWPFNIDYCSYAVTLPIAVDSKSKQTTLESGNLEKVAAEAAPGCYCESALNPAPIEAIILLGDSKVLQIPIQPGMTTSPLHYWDRTLPADAQPPTTLRVHFFALNQSKCIVHHIPAEWQQLTNSLWRPTERKFWQFVFPDGVQILNLLFPRSVTSEQERLFALTQLHLFKRAQITFESYSPTLGYIPVRCKFDVALSARAGYPPPPPDADLDPSLDNPFLNVIKRALWHGLLAKKPLHAFAPTLCVKTTESLLKCGFDPYALLQSGSPAVTPISLAMMQYSPTVVALMSAANHGHEQSLCSPISNDVLISVLEYLFVGTVSHARTFGRFCLTQRKSLCMIVRSNDAHIGIACKIAPLPLLVSKDPMSELDHLRFIDLYKKHAPRLKINTSEPRCWVVGHLRSRHPDVLRKLLGFLGHCAFADSVLLKLSSDVRNLTILDRILWVGDQSGADTFYLFDLLEPTPCATEICPLRGLRCRDPLHCLRPLPVHLNRQTQDTGGDMDTVVAPSIV
eukprot:TRINITY_DN6368_c0_g1_i1.p1 TRINITY_DN6368_c0_g1~~TRINITY_DN6368_c0_g1_i1.p1  ORF type:complete len:718 (+),score=54.77 TRINITY_DN6368_c0_g1_i1:552-2705(+)